MTNKSKKILADISAGELLDKISILEIKLEKVTDKINLHEVKKEYDMLKKTQNFSIEFNDDFKSLFNILKEVNLILWNTEDKIRICEKNKDFGKSFVELARQVYINNDKRSQIKSQINKKSGSNIREVKQYIDY
jgi:adenine C2-methylase RlmN of 23S rRNA A2503 and tRNA A37|tara:strand:- start:389 stop:790 length:402 start_codon:yes stop_codon:yes gene_type:complete